jgi:hypothetical protein
MQTVTEANPARRGRAKKETELLRDGKQITLRFPPSVEREVKAVAEEEGLITRVWIRRLVVLELRRLRRRKAGT